MLERLVLGVGDVLLCRGWLGHLMDKPEASFWISLGCTATFRPSIWGLFEVAVTVFSSTQTGYP